jgi:hypothetical protein
MRPDLKRALSEQLLAKLNCEFVHSFLDLFCYSQPFQGLKELAFLSVEEVVGGHLMEPSLQSPNFGFVVHHLEDLLQEVPLPSFQSNLYFQSFGAAVKET